MMDCILHQRLQDQFQHQNIQQIFIHFIFNADFIIIPDIDDRHVTFDNIQFFPHRDHLTSAVQTVSVKPSQCLCHLKTFVLVTNQSKAADHIQSIIQEMGIDLLQDQIQFIFPNDLLFFLGSLQKLTDRIQQIIIGPFQVGDLILTFFIHLQVLRNRFRIHHLFFHFLDRSAHCTGNKKPAQDQHTYIDDQDDERIEITDTVGKTAHRCLYS